MDPSADMLALAGTDAANVTWVLGSDDQVSSLDSLLGKKSLDLVMIGQALHWMDAAQLFAALTPLLRPGGGIAVISNGTRYRGLLNEAGFTVDEHAIDYTEEFTVDEVIGSFYSAAPLERLNPEQRAGFDADLRSALLAAQPDGRFVEEVPSGHSSHTGHSRSRPVRRITRREHAAYRPRCPGQDTEQSGSDSWAPRSR